MSWQRRLMALALAAIWTTSVSGEEAIELTGRVVFEGNPDYERGRLVSNYYASKDKFPTVIVYCESIRDIQNAIKWAKSRNLPVRIRSGGHNHEAFSTGTNAVVIDVSGMKKLKIDKEKRIATVEPGLTGGELYRALGSAGLTQVGGTCADVGISGLVLTGGMGPLLRREGMACDQLIAFDLVDARGELLRVTADNDYKDLFWACCGGGGGNFGVVVSMVLKIYPAGPVTWFNIGWEWDQPVEEIAEVWQKMFSSEDKQWFSHLDLWSKAFPSERYKKHPIKALGVFYGSAEEAKRGLEPLLKVGKPSEQTFEVVPWVKAIQLFEEATSVFVTDKPEYKSTGAYAMKPLPQEAFKIIIKALNESTEPLFNVLFFTLGGAAAKKAPTATAYFYRQAPFFVMYTSQWLNSGDANKAIAMVDQLRGQLLPFTEGNYLGNPDRSIKNYLTTYFGENAARLQAIKAKYDPENLFQFEQGLVVKAAMPD